MKTSRGPLGKARYEGNVKVVPITGDFTKDTTPCVCRYIEEDMKSRKVKAVLLDFAEVTGVDTAAFACLIDVIKAHSEGLAGIGIVNIHDKGGSLLEILRLQDVIKTFKNEQEALSYLNSL